MKLLAMSTSGDEAIAEWNAASTTQELAHIDEEFSSFIAKGFSAFLLDSGVRVRNFSPEITEDIFLVAPVAGG